MKKVCYILIVVSFLMISCNKHEKNGEFAGNWQLTEMKDLTGNVITTNCDTSRIFYTVSLSLMKFQNYFDNSGIFYLAYFNRYGNNLEIGKVFRRPDDDIVPNDSLKQFGVTEDGKFTIIRLNEEEMILRNSLYILSFRKF